LSEGKDRRPQDFHEESFENRSRRKQIVLYRVLAECLSYQFRSVLWLWPEDFAARQRRWLNATGPDQKHQRRCACRKLRPCWSGGMSVFVDDAAEPVVAADVQAGDDVRVGDRCRDRA
jgi:hypothetical protein